MPSPLVHTLLPTALAASSPQLRAKLTRGDWVPFLIVCVLLGNSPDFDLLPTVIGGNATGEFLHRWYGHNVFSFVALLLLGNWLFRRFVPTLSPSQRSITTALLVASHFILDGMVFPQIQDTGVPLFFPFTRLRFHAPFWLFSRMTDVPGMPRLTGFLTSPENWRFVFGYELASVLTLWLLITLSSRVAVFFWAKTKGVWSPVLQSSRQYSPEPPLPLPPDGSQNRTYTGS